MGKALKAIYGVLPALVMILVGVLPADAKEKKIPDEPKFVGAVKCNGSCHDPYYQAWKNSPHGKTFDLLKPGERAEAKKRVKLDPDKDYTSTPLCLRCHTTGYGQKGGFKPAGSVNKKGKDVSAKIDPDEPNKEQVGCEMCHSVAGGGQFRVVMKNTKGDFKKAETEKYGQRWDYANVCTRCHTHRNTPFQTTVHDKYKFNFEERVKKVHPIDKYWTEDNKDQKLEKTQERKKEQAVSQKKPLSIEDFDIVNDEIKFKEGTLPMDPNSGAFRYKG